MYPSWGGSWSLSAILMPANISPSSNESFGCELGAPYVPPSCTSAMRTVSEERISYLSTNVGELQACRLPVAARERWWCPQTRLLWRTSQVVQRRASRWLKDGDEVRRCEATQHIRSRVYIQSTTHLNTLNSTIVTSRSLTCYLSQICGWSSAERQPATE